jgi:SPP1 gp7 family putative phage head morphogenesis protein
MKYWQDRQTEELNKLSDKTIRETERQIKKYYEATMRRTIADFEATYNKILATIEEGREITPADLYKLDKYWEAQAQLRKELNKLGEKQITLLSRQFETNFFEIYYSFGKVGDKAFNTIDTAAVQQLINSIWVADGKSWSQRIWENTELLAETLNEGLIHCVATGKKPTELKNILQERFGVSYSRADTLVRTEIAHIQNQATIQRYKDAGILEVQVWTTEDERRCEICGTLHKKKFLVSERLPVPAHPNCRCSVVPVVETII